VCDLADNNRASLGFLPRSAYQELASREQLWVVSTGDNDLAGYLLFGGSRSRIRVFQIHVAGPSRRCGIGDALVTELKKHATNKGIQTITARVAADLPANAFWEKQGFRIAKQVAGGMSSHRLINDRLFEVRGCSLWNPPEDSSHLAEPRMWLPQQQPILSVPTFALDLNVLFDVVKDREHAALMQEVLSNALGNEYRLCVTTEFAKELERSSYANTEDPILKLARSLPTLPPVPGATLDNLKSELRKLLFPEVGRSQRRQANDQSDLAHLALCVHHHVSGFVTREVAILRNARAIYERHGIEILSPPDILANSSGQVQEVGTVQANVAGATFAFAALKEQDRKGAEKFLLSQRVSRSRSDQILEAGTTQAPRTRILFTIDGVIVAVASWSRILQRKTTLYLVANEAAALSEHAVDHVLESIANAVAGPHIACIELHTGPAQILSRETASKRGYVAAEGVVTEDGFVVQRRYAYAGIVSEANWEHFAKELEGVTASKVTRRFPTYAELSNTGLVFDHAKNNKKTPVSLFQLETAFSPVLILPRGRPAIITPIREDYANELIPTATRQFALLAKEAPAHIERAYFGKLGIERFFERGAIVIFYISGKRNEAVGFARVTASGRYAVDVAKSLFARQGVLEADELAVMSQNGQIGVFTFDSYRNFLQPIPFSVLRSRNIASAANLVTSQEINYDQLMKLIEMGAKR
jgi:hypothetical protein